MGSLSLFPFQTHISQLHWAGHRRHHDRQSTSARAQQQPVGLISCARSTRPSPPVHFPRYSYLAHSQYALQLVMGMRIGQVQVAGVGEVAMEMSVVGAGQPFRFHAASSALPSAPPLSAVSGALVLRAIMSVWCCCTAAVALV